MSGFWTGTLVGAFLIASITVAVERTRRARADLRAARKAVKTLRRIFWTTLVAALKLGALVAVAVGALVALALMGGHR